MEANKVVPALCRSVLTNRYAPPGCRLAQIDLLDDDDLDELHAQRIREMKAEALRREEAKKKGCVPLSLAPHTLRDHQECGTGTEQCS